MKLIVRRGGVAAVLAALAASATLAAKGTDAYGQGWSAIGASGIPVSATEWMVQTNYQPTMSLRSSVSQGTALVKYNVVATPDLGSAPQDQPNLCMWVIFRADNPSSRVRATLYSIWFNDVPAKALYTLDSNDFPPQELSGYREMFTCRIPNPDYPSAMLQTLSFFHQAYYVEVELTRTDASGNPGIKAIGIGHDTP